NNHAHYEEDHGANDWQQSATRWVQNRGYNSAKRKAG
ncbi:MAG: hypothetical protein RIR41_837, partial [Pseudomonadota bacterium]